MSDIAQIIQALAQLAGTPLGTALISLIVAGTALWLDKRYAKKSDLELIVEKWDLKAESLEATGDRIISNEGSVHEKINEVTQRVSGIESACKVHHPIH